MNTYAVTIRGNILTAVPLGDDDETPDHAPNLIDYDRPGIYFYRSRFWMIY